MLELSKASAKASGRAVGLRMFALFVSLSLFGAYFAALYLAGGIAWSVELWAGSIALSGVAGLLTSYLVAPPPVRTAAGQ